MEDSSASFINGQHGQQHSRSLFDSQPVPHQLKFLMSNIKSIISVTLNADNYPIWRSQVFKIFKANGFEGFLDGSCICPLPTEPSSSSMISFQTWNLIDQNLVAALYSVISPNLLPYVLTVDHCQEIWDILARRLQSSTRSRSIQLRNELHHLSMRNLTMSQYLLEVKSKVDAIAATSSPLNPEDVILYTLNGLPSQYQAFKTAIRTNLQPLSLDDLYTLLCSEEQNLAQETTKELQNLQISEPALALAAPRGRGRGRSLCLLSSVHWNLSGFGSTHLDPCQFRIRPNPDLKTHFDTPKLPVAMTSCILNFNSQLEFLDSYY